MKWCKRARKRPFPPCCRPFLAVEAAVEYLLKRSVLKVFHRLGGKEMIYVKNLVKKSGMHQPLFGLACRPRAFVSAAREIFKKRFILVPPFVYAPVVFLMMSETVSRRCWSFSRSLSITRMA